MILRTQCSASFCRWGAFAAVLGALVPACGGPAPAPVAEVAVAPPPPEPFVCAYPIAAMQAAGFQAWYLTPPVDGVLEWTWPTAAAPGEGSGEGSGDSAVDPERAFAAPTFALRDDRGLQTGTESWVCTADGLALQGVVTPVRTVVFEPPVPLLPLQPGTGEQHGAVLYRDDDGERRLAYVWSGTSTRVGALDDTFDRAGARWTQVASVLDMADPTTPDAPGWQIFTTTLWVEHADRVLPVQRQQRMRFDNALEERTEVLERMSPRLP